jgi:hypothetical protein
MISNKMLSHFGIYSEHDWDGDGAIEYRSSEQSTYDKRGNPTSKVSEYEYDYDADGTIDERYLTRYEYDYKNNVNSALFEEDPGADGTIDDRTVGYPVDPDDMIASLSADLLPDQPLLQ